jgi:hypothetical protein
MDSNTRAVITAAAEARGIPPAHLLAFVQVESAGRIFARIKGRDFPLILFEPHKLYRRTAGEIRARLVAERLASETWKKKLYPASQEARWDQARRAAEIAGPVAYECVSWGVGQVLGEHWRALGYASLQVFIDRACAGLDGQLELMLRYLDVNGLTDDLQAGRWPVLFRGYNGPKWRQNGYGDRIFAALREFGGAAPKPDGMLRMGSRGKRVRELQALLVRAGYQVRADGDFGPATRDALKAFQTAHGITPDGVYGPETESRLGGLRQGPADKPGDVPVTQVPEVLQGAGGVGGAVAIEQAREAVDAATAQLQQVDGLGQVVSWGLGALSVLAALLAVAAVAYAAWGWWQSRQTVEA